jgi:acyl-coenzyme A synthetase/AMP-(fatty) acid ligase
MHRHGAIPVVCETYAAQVPGIRPGDRCLSAAKAFFAYGLGNSVLFPLSVGAATVLEHARGASAATGYWCRYDTSRQVFQGEWLRTGDTYIRDADGCYTCLGRTSDMLKPSGVWVSPAEVEARLLAHEAIAQAATLLVPRHQPAKAVPDEG